MIEVSYKYHCGTDLDVANAARVSFDKESEWAEVPQCYEAGGETRWTGDYRLKYQDVRLINFLARGYTAEDFDKFVAEVAEAGYTWSEIGGAERWDKLLLLLRDWRGTGEHKSPFNHVFISFRVKAPLFVAAQLKKHKFLPWNEVSRRYVDSEPEFYMPEVWRGRAENKKQGSSGEVELSKFSMAGDGPPSETGWEADLLEAHHSVLQDVLFHYQALLKAGVAPEMARMVLPQAMQTEWIWSGTLGAWADMCRLRCAPDAQYESRIVANKIKDKLIEIYPVSMPALMNYGMDIN